MTPFVRNLLILAAVAVVIVVFNQETALATASTLIRFAFFIVAGICVYVALRTWLDQRRHT